MLPDPAITTVAHVIQWAVAPVFLLTGVGAILSVLTNRLARIVDRARVIESRLTNSAQEQQAVFNLELDVLARRSRLINLAISLCTTSALLICIVIAALFVGAFLVMDVSSAIALLFVVAMLALIGGLINFLREIHLATTSMRIGAK